MRTQLEKSSKRSCLITSVLLFVVVPITLLTIGLILWFGRESSGRSQLNAKIANLAKKGYPVDNASVDAFYKARTDPTNTDAWLAILATLKSREFETSLVGVPFVGIVDEPPSQLDEKWNEEGAALVFLNRWKELGDESIRLSLDASPVRFPIVFDSFNSMDVNQVQAFRQVARFINLRGYVAMRSRDSIRVHEAIEGMLGLSRMIAGEPMLVSHLVTIAIDGMAIGLLKEALKNDVLSTEDLQSVLPKSLELAQIGKDWETALAGERALALPLFSNPTRARSSGLATLFSNARDAIGYVDLIDSLLDLPTEELTEFRDKLQEVESKLQSRTSANWLAQMDNLMTMQVVPAVSATGHAFIRRALQHRIASLAIALRLHEHLHGKFPDSLDELPEIKKVELFSPSKKQKFGYRTEGRDAKLWGGNFQDAFAIPNEPPESDDPDTFVTAVWLWELPARVDSRRR